MIGVVLAVALLLQGAPASRTGVVAGQVNTRDGVPAPAVRVSAIPAPPPDARPEDGSQYYATPPPAGSVLTDSRGRYRLPTLPPGRYLIAAGVRGEATYHPATMDARQAVVVAVAAGSTADGVDVRLATPYGGRVRGRVSPPPSSDPQETAVLSGVRLEELLEVPVGPDGTFEFGHVPRGSYLISLFPTPPGMPSLPFQVGDDDVTSLALVRRPLRTVTGRIVARTGPLPHVLLAFVTPTSHVTATVAEDGSFRARLQAARHVVDVGGLPVGYSVASIRLGGKDVSAGVTIGDADLPGLVITLNGAGSTRPR
jgi:hypothetical protein